MGALPGGGRCKVTEKLKVRHTGNAGVLLYIEGKALGFDALCRDPEGIYHSTSEEEKEAILREIEERRLEALVFTHEHGDHFWPEAVWEALERNPRLLIISGKEVCRKIRERAKEAVLYEIAPEERQTVRIRFPREDAELCFFNSPHMGEAYQEVQNLACLAEIKGRKLFIPGDARPDRELFRRAAVWSEEIDCLAAPFPLAGLPSARKELAAALKVRHIMALHLPLPERDVQNWVESARRVCGQAEDGLPRPVFVPDEGRELLL